MFDNARVEEEQDKMGRLLGSARRIYRDVRAFGLRPVRRISRAKRNAIVTVDLAKVGPVDVRAGNSDLDTLRQVFQEGEYDTSFLSHLDARLKARHDEIMAAGKKPLIIDAGANIGAASLWFRRKYPDARLVAVEPDASNARLLRRNLSRYPDVVICEAAIGATSGFVELSYPYPEAWAVQTSRSETGSPMIAVEDIFRANVDAEPFIVKIDIEGFESDLFASNTRWLESAFAVIIEPHDWMFPRKKTSFALQRAMAEHPFELLIRGENLFYVRA